MNNDDKRARRAANAADKQDREDFVNGLKSCLSTREGRWFIWEILAWTSLFHDAFSPEANRMAFIVGQQSIGKRLLAEISDEQPEAWLQMIQENQERQDARPGPQSESAG